MAIIIDDIRISNTLNSGDCRYLAGNCFEKMTAEIDFTISEGFQVGLTGDPDGVYFGSTNYPNIPGVVELVDGSGRFKNFNIGDTIFIATVSIYIPLGNYTITNKWDDNTIQINTTWTTNFSDDDALFYLVPSFTAFDFFYGLIENNEALNFNSKLDGETQKYTVNGVSSTGPTYNFLSQGNYKSWEIGSATIERTAVTTYTVSYTIIHTFYINPWFLSTNQQGVWPTIWNANKCLKYVFSIKARPTQNDYNRQQEVEYENELGNSGWFDENLNTGYTNYSISNLSYEKLSDSSIQTGLLLTDSETTVIEFDIDNTTDSPFSNNNTKFRLSVINVPFDSTEYIDTTTKLDANFTLDAKTNTVGSAAASGEFARCLTNVQGTYVSSSKIRITARFTLTTNDFNRINAFDDKKFFICCSVANHTKTIDDTDSVTLIVDYEDYAIELGTDNAVTSSVWYFIEHPDHANNVIADSIDYDYFSEDEILSFLRIKIDATNALYSPSLEKIECGIQLYNSVTGQRVVLDNAFESVGNNNIVNGLQHVNSSQPRTFKALSTELFKNFTIERNYPIESTDIYYYDIKFPFMIAWEYWIANNNIPSAFFDQNEDNNGLNDEWQRLDNVTNWGLYMYADVTVSFNGVDSVYRLTKQFNGYDYDSNGDWINEDIKTFDSSNNNLQGNILGYADTTVVCEFEYAGSNTLTVNDVEIVMRIEPYENGGRGVSTRFSSVITMTSDTQWVSSNTSNLIVKTKTSNTFKGTAKLDYTLLQNFSNFAITARIYDLTTGASTCNINGLLMEDGSCWITETGEDLVIE